VDDSAGRRAAAAAIVLMVVWIATYWLWEPRTAETAGVVIDEPVAAEVVPGDPPERQSGARAERPVSRPALAQTDPLQSGPEIEESGYAAGSQGGQVVIPPEFRAYTVKTGDQIMTIAKRLYGDTRHWQAIAKANPEVDPQKLRVGQTIRVPKDPGNIQGVVVDAGESSPPPAPEPETIEHVVQNNDSLWKIAAAFYGDGTKWRLIRDANRELVGDEGQRLRPGMTLVIPPAPNGAR